MIKKKQFNYFYPLWQPTMYIVYIYSMRVLGTQKIENGLFTRINNVLPQPSAGTMCHLRNRDLFHNVFLFYVKPFFLWEKLQHFPPHRAVRARIESKMHRISLHVKNKKKLSRALLTKTLSFLHLSAGCPWQVCTNRF